MAFLRRAPKKKASQWHHEQRAQPHAKKWRQGVCLHHLFADHGQDVVQQENGKREKCRHAQSPSSHQGAE